MYVQQQLQIKEAKLLFMCADNEKEAQSANKDHFYLMSANGLDLLVYLLDGLCKYVNRFLMNNTIIKRASIEWCLLDSKYFYPSMYDFWYHNIQLSVRWTGNE